MPLDCCDSVFIYIHVQRQVITPENSDAQSSPLPFGKSSPESIYCIFFFFFCSGMLMSDSQFLGTPALVDTFPQAIDPATVTPSLYVSVTYCLAMNV